MPDLNRPSLAPPQTCAEILRLAEAGMGTDKLGGRFRLPYAVITRILAAERKRRADAWARRGPSLGWPERRVED